MESLNAIWESFRARFDGIVKALAVCMLIIALGWFVLWRLILGKIPLFQEILGFREKKENQERRKRPSRLIRTHRRSMRKHD